MSARKFKKYYTTTTETVIETPVIYFPSSARGRFFVFISLVVVVHHSLTTTTNRIGKNNNDVSCTRTTRIYTYSYAEHAPIPVCSAYGTMTRVQCERAGSLVAAATAERGHKSTEIIIKYTRPVRLCVRVRPYIVVRAPDRYRKSRSAQKKPFDNNHIIIIHSHY